MTQAPGANRASQGTTELHAASQLLESVLAAATDFSIISTDTQGVIQVFNKGAEKLLGYTAAEMVGRQTPARIHLAEEVMARSAELTQTLGRSIEGFRTFVEVAEQQGSEAREWTYVRKDGHHITVSLVVTAMRDHDGHLIGYLGIAEDITRRKAVERALRESEQRFRHMLETCPTAARIARSNGREVIFSNQRYAKLINAEVHQVTGVDPALFYVDDRVYDDILQRLSKGEQVFDKLVELKAPTVGVIWALASYLPIQYEGENAVLAWFYDITDLKRAEAEIADQARHTQAILDNMVDGLITIDAKGIVQEINPAAARIFGHEIADLVGQNVSMLMPSPHREAHDGYLQHYQRTGVAGIIGSGREVEGLRRDGSLFPMDLAVSEIIQHGQTLYVGMVRDISERKRIEQLKSDFVSTVSHELRTPLTAIAGALGLVASGTLGEFPERSQRMIDIAYKNSLRLKHLINDLLDMEKITAGKLHFDLQARPLMPLLMQALDSHRTYGAEHRVNLVLTSAPVDATVWVDDQRLMQVLANLLSNAIKFSPTGAAVEVNVQRRPKAVKVAVIDHGTGIPDSFRSRIFEKFSQADSSDSRQKGGTGLGLAISRELMERMGGSIGFESQAGAGATFWIELPLHHSTETDDSCVIGTSGGDNPASKTPPHHGSP